MGSEDFCVWQGWLRDDQLPVWLAAVRQDLYPSKNNFGKEKVKFWMLYQRLTTIDPGPGKEN